MHLSVPPPHFGFKLVLVEKVKITRPCPLGDKREFSLVKEDFFDILIFGPFEKNHPGYFPLPGTKVLGCLRIVKFFVSSLAYWELYGQCRLERSDIFSLPNKSQTFWIYSVNNTPSSPPPHTHTHTQTNKQTNQQTHTHTWE